jgi:hypothetical protein
MVGPHRAWIITCAVMIPDNYICLSIAGSWELWFLNFSNCSQCKMQDPMAWASLPWDLHLEKSKWWCTTDTAAFPVLILEKNFFLKIYFIWPLRQPNSPSQLRINFIWTNMCLLFQRIISANFGSELLQGKIKNWKKWMMTQDIPQTDGWPTSSEVKNLLGLL